MNIFNRKRSAILAIITITSLSSCLRKSSSTPPRNAPPASEPTTAEVTSVNTPISFNRDIQPILSEYCYSCHGFDPATRFPKEEPLRLDQASFATLKRKDGSAAIVPGQPEQSSLIKRLLVEDPEKVMPPPSFHKTVPAATIAVLKEWIRQGAVYEPHWAFTPPRKSPPPATAKDPWVRSTTDAWILSALHAKHLDPQPQADPRRLIRRVTLDLTGLLPDPTAVETFAANPSDAAYTAYVEQLLNSPDFGEHRARYWLDYTRYADTHGKHYDNARSIWPWRDYVIRSFNDNKPFDRFVHEQIAGDLLPDGNLDSLIATGYLRNAVTTNEFGTIPEEILVDRTRDRTEAFGSAFLGLTVGCAACHDHKFDPITQKDFYSLFAFFHHTTEKPWDENRSDPPPVLRIPQDPSTREQLNAKVADLCKARARIEELRQQSATRLQQSGLNPIPVDPAGLELHLRADEGKGNILHNSAPGRSESFEITTNPPFWDEESVLWPALRLDMNSRIAIPQHGDFEANQSFTAASWVKPRLKTGNVTTGAGSLFSRMGDMQRMAHRGWDVYLEGDLLIVHIVHQWPLNAIRVESPGFPRGQWSHITVRYDGSAKASGVSIWINGKPATLKIAHDSLQPGQTIRTDAPFHIARREDTQPLRETAYQDLRLYRRFLSDEEIQRLPSEDPAAQTLDSSSLADLSEDRRNLVLYRWFHLSRDPKVISLRTKITHLESEINEISKNGDPTLIANDKVALPEAFVLDRGVYSARKDHVHSQAPHFLPAIETASPPSRLDLARWLTRPDHPLFARVTVNRIWQELFGIGLVDSPDDFGIMGSRPTHPELLDDLAIQFRESGWNVKQLYRELVLSSTYRQAETSHPAATEKDPANRLFSHGPRFRMDAEVLRDTALQSSGLLIRKLGGAPVFPYQPTGLWEAVSMPESNTFRYNQQQGEGLYRRSLYSFWKRFAPPPSLETFDSPAREVVCSRRARTNTPLQALVLMNDPQFVEASRKLAERAILSSQDPHARLDFLAHTLLSRALTSPEKQRFLQNLQTYQQHYTSQPADAEALMKTGEAPANASLQVTDIAAWTLVTSQFFNLDEFLNR